MKRTSSLVECRLGHLLLFAIALLLFIFMLNGSDSLAWAQGDDDPTSSDTDDSEAQTPDEADQDEGSDEEEEESEPWLAEQVPESWKSSWGGLPTYQWIALSFIIVLGVVVDFVTRRLLFTMTLGWVRFTTKQEKAAVLGKKAFKPMGLLAMAIVWYLGMVWIGLPSGLLGVLLFIVRIFGVGMGVWTAFLFIDMLAEILKVQAEKTRTKFDDLLAPLVSRSLKVLTVCLGVVTMAQACGWPIAGLISGMGIGGLAIAFAAKETLGNLFGSATILLDRPFEIGDWIVCGDVEGSVETVGMRSTRVRTFYNSLVTVPNNVLMTAVIDNMGQRRYRRIKTQIKLQYDTPPDRIQAFCEGVRELIRRHAYTRKDYYHVYLNQFDNSSLNVLLYCFLECPDWSVELRERERLFLDILRVANELDVMLAFPTQTVHIASNEQTPRSRKPLDAEDPPVLGRRLAAKVAGRPLPPEKKPGPVPFDEWHPFEGIDDDGDGGE
jgi:MscS family membrane protein